MTRPALSSTLILLLLGVMNAGTTGASGSPWGASVRPTKGPRENPSRIGEAWHDVQQRYISDRLGIEASVRYFALRHKRRPEDARREETFLGFINELNKVDPLALRLALGYRINDWLALEGLYEDIAARTRNFNNKLSDGNVRLRGPMVSLVASYPLTERFTPYAGLGYAFMSARFKHDAWWTWGWSSPEAYQAAGSPQASPGGRRRFIDVRDDSGPVATLGLRYTASDRLEINAAVRRVDLNVKAHAYGAVNGIRERGQQGEFPMSHTAYSAGLIYVF
jgi:opacity protein-like surface antigen